MAKKEFEDMHIKDKVFDVIYHMAIDDIWFNDPRYISTHTLKEVEEDEWILDKDDASQLVYNAIKELSESTNVENYIFKCLFAAHYYEFAEFTDDNYYDDDTHRGIKIVPKYDLNIGNDVVSHVCYSTDGHFVPGVSTVFDLDMEEIQVLSFLIEFRNDDGSGPEYLNFSYCIKISFEDVDSFTVKLLKLIN